MSLPQAAPDPKVLQECDERWADLLRQISALEEENKKLRAGVVSVNSTDSRTASENDADRKSADSVPQPTSLEVYKAGTYRTHSHPERFWETTLWRVDDGAFIGVIAGATLDEAETNARRIQLAVNSFDSLLMALKGIEQFAQDQIVDLGASWQEGCAANVTELRRWADVIHAIKRAEGRR